jgi:predicted RNase H-like HicB family nuclease
MEEAVANGREALRDCLEVLAESGRKMPKRSVEAAQMAPAARPFTHPCS